MAEEQVDGLQADQQADSATRLAPGDAVTQPLKRVGRRGGGQWERVSWDEALWDISSAVGTIVRESGPQAIAAASGDVHGPLWPEDRFLSLAGSPNNIDGAQVNGGPRTWAQAVTFGWPVEPDVSEKTGAIVVWGADPASADDERGRRLWQAIEARVDAGAPLVVVDPCKSRTAEVATLWLAPQPCTDPLLALCTLREVIRHGGVDKAFVDAWCEGFDELSQQVELYAPMVAEMASGVPACKVTALAGAWIGHGPVALVVGRGVDQMGPNALSTHRALCCLQAITGNLDRPGACRFAGDSQLAGEVVLDASDRLPVEQRERSLARGSATLATWEGWEALSAETAKVAGRRLSPRHLASAHPGLVWHAVAEGDPYPVRAMLTYGPDALTDIGDSFAVRQALAKLDLVVALDGRLSPAAAMADWVLPILPSGAKAAGKANAAGRAGKRSGVGITLASLPTFVQRSAADVDGPRDAYRVWRGLALACGQDPTDWPDRPDAASAADELLGDGGKAPSGDADGAGGAWDVRQRDGVSPGTPSGKVELASTLLPQFGGDALPTPKPIENIEGGVGHEQAMFLDLLTGPSDLPYQHIAAQGDAEVSPERLPQAWVAPKLAERMGLVEGDIVEVTAQRGHGRFALAVRDMVPATVAVERGWWLLEHRLTDERFAELFENNGNMLTGCEVSGGPEDLVADSVCGTWRQSGILCTISKVDRYTGEGLVEQEVDEQTEQLAARIREALGEGGQA